jgi:hypothetical protein
MLGPELIVSTLTTPALRKLAELLTSMLWEAKEDYQETPKDVASPFELKRSRLLGKLSTLQTKILLYVSNQAQLAKVLAILTDQTIQTYKAKTEQELELVELSLGQIEGLIRRDEKVVRQRRFARTLAIIVSFTAIAGLVVIMYFATDVGGPSTNTVLPIIQIPLPILLWSAIGSFAAILYRFNKSGDIELQDPLRWLFTRPLTGIVMGIVAYFMLSIGFLAVGTRDASSFGGSVVFWLVAFISGFSDRFADGLLKSLVGRFGGDDRADVITLDDIPSSDSSSLASFLEGLPVFRDWVKKYESETKTSEKATDSISKADEVEQTQPISNVASDNLSKNSTSSDLTSVVVENTN